MGMAVAGSYSQEMFRFRNDDGSEAAATWKDLANTNVTLDASVFRLRFRVTQTVFEMVGDLPKTFKVRFSHNSGAYTDVGAGQAVQYASSPYVIDGEATTWSATRSGTWVPGEIDNNNATGEITFVESTLSWTELEFILQLNNGVAVNYDTIDFRVYETNDTALNTYTNTARATAFFTVAPNVPALLTPDDLAELPLASENTFTWQFSSDEPGDSQTAYVFERAPPLPLVVDVPICYSGYGCDFSPDGTLLAVAHHVNFDCPAIVVLNTSDWSTVSGTPTLAGSGYACAFNPAGTLLATAHANTPFMRVYNTSNWSAVSGTPTLPSWGLACAFNPDGTLLAVGHLNSPFLTVINTSNWSVVSNTPVLASTGRGVAFSPDGTLLAVAHSTSPFLTVLNTSDWSVVSNTPVLASTGYGLAFSPDGTLLAVGHDLSPFLTVINTSNWSTVSNTPVLAGAGYGCAFSPDGTLLAVAHPTSPCLTVLNTSNWSTVSGILTLPGTGRGVAFNPAGTLLAVGHLNSPFLTVADIPLNTPEYWNGTSWQLTEVFVTSTTEGVTFPTNAWVNTP